MSRGHDRERRVRDYLQERDWLVIRAAGSLGVADLVAIRPGRVLLVEVKSTAGGPWERFGPAARQRLRLAAELGGCEATLCWWPIRSAPVWIPSASWPR